jgi:opacity protein-like surface antigen
MRKTLMVMGLMLMGSGAALAQDTPKAEVAGNYTYMRFAGGVNCNGGGGSVAGNFNKWFGMVGDFSACRFTGGGNAVTYMFGPKLSYRSSSRVTPYFQTLFGGMHLPAANAFAMAAGGGVDVKVSDRFAVRVVQAEYLLTHFGGVRQNNFRLSAGVVFRFGSK